MGSEKLFTAGQSIYILRLVSVCMQQIGACLASIAVCTDHQWRLTMKRRSHQAVMNCIAFDSLLTQHSLKQENVIKLYKKLQVIGLKMS